MNPARLEIVDLGRMGYADAYEVQVETLNRVLAARGEGAPVVGTLLLVEHDPVVTVSRRPAARSHLLASPEQLARAGVRVEETDRGGDITYHGPGQVVAYPILDLNHLHLRLHEYVRILEEAVIGTCAAFGVRATRDPGATGVWTEEGAKICAIGLRVRRWVSMHGLALNVHVDLDHFRLIVPCGLAGRPVTSLRAVLGDGAPDMEAVKAALIDALGMRLERRAGVRAMQR